jgi:hypothetical protein
MRKRVAEIINTPYVDSWGESTCLCEPTKDEIERAVREDDIEKRGYQTHLTELVNEWNNKARSFQEYCQHVRGYHAKRVAFFVKKKWADDPIVLNKDGCTIREGLHRLKAAIYLNMEYVEVANDPEIA